MSFIAPLSVKTMFFELNDKFNPELYTLALRQSGITADQSVVFEDSL